MRTDDLQELLPTGSYYTVFGFDVVGKAMRASEIQYDILDTTKKIMDITQDFFVPMMIKYILTTYLHDAPSQGSFYMGRYINAIHRELSNENGISFEMLKEDVDSIETPAGQIRYIDEIELIGRTKFVFKDGQAFIDGLRETRLIERDGVSSKKEIITRLFWISISNPEYKVNETMGSYTSAHYLVDFDTIAGVYGEDSELGRANRNLLRGVFKKLCANFNIYKTNFRSDWFSDEVMDFIAFGGDQYPE